MQLVSPPAHDEHHFVGAEGTTLVLRVPHGAMTADVDSVQFELAIDRSRQPWGPMARAVPPQAAVRLSGAEAQQLLNSLAEARRPFAAPDPTLVAKGIEIHGTGAEPGATAAFTVTPMQVGTPARQGALFKITGGAKEVTSFVPAEQLHRLCEVWQHVLSATEEDPEVLNYEEEERPRMAVA